MSEWKEVRLGDVIEIIGGGTPKTTVSEYWNGDIPWLSVVDFNDNNRKVYTTEKTITTEGLKNSSTKILNENDIIISARGTVGAIAQLGCPMAFNQSCYGLRGTSDIDNTFLYYLLKTKIAEMQAKSHGSVFNTITRNTFDNIILSLPPLETQKRIATALSSLDEKIELNNKINKDLEDMAQAIFKSWFVNFEPFGGVMPDGWREGVLGDIANITMGQSPDGNSYNENSQGEVFYQGRAEFGARFPTHRLFTTEPKRFANENSVLMSVRAPVGDINVAFERCCIGRGLSSIESRIHASSFILYTMLSLKQALNVYNGEGTVFGSINKDTLYSQAILIPASDFIEKFENLVSPLDEQTKNNYSETIHLSQIRDTLLPRLMSGEIDVENVEVS